MKPRELIPSLLTAALVAGAGAAVATAGTEGTSGATDNAAEAMFRRLDLNHDNSISREEAARQKDFLQAFGKADANRDNRLSREEFAQAYSAYDRMRVGAFVDDSMITARIKTAFIEDPDVSALDVGVETDKGVVLLSGFVRNPHQAQRAVEIASAVSGVKSVKSSLAVKNY